MRGFRRGIAKFLGLPLSKQSNRPRGTKATDRGRRHNRMTSGVTATPPFTRELRRFAKQRA